MRQLIMPGFLWLDAGWTPSPKALFAFFTINSVVRNTFKAMYAANQKMLHDKNSVRHIWGHDKVEDCRLFPITCALSVCTL